MTKSCKGCLLRRTLAQASSDVYRCLNMGPGLTLESRNREDVYRRVRGNILAGGHKEELLSDLSIASEGAWIGCLKAMLDFGYRNGRRKFVTRNNWGGELCVRKSSCIGKKRDISQPQRGRRGWWNHTTRRGLT